MLLSGRSALDVEVENVLRPVLGAEVEGIEAGGGEVGLHGADGRHLPPVLDVLPGAGCELCWSRKCITLRAQGRRKAVSAIETAPYPGFPTDVQAPMMAALLRMEGSCRFSETIFERRFAHVPQLRRFGAEIETEGSAALVRGVASLRPATVTGTDLRGAAALVIAALQAPGVSTIYGIKHLRRGYDNLEGKLRALGVTLSEADGGVGKNTTGNFPCHGV